MADMMTFPETWEEFEKSYGFDDSDEVYRRMTKKEAVKVIDNRFEIMDYCESAKLEEALDMAIKALEQSERKKGKWIEMGTNPDGTHNIKCSKCGEGYKTRGHAMSFNTRERYKYCPNCGAKMER